MDLPDVIVSISLKHQVVVDRVTEVTDLVVVVQKIRADLDIAFPPPDDNRSTEVRISQGFFSIKLSRSSGVEVLFPGWAAAARAGRPRRRRRRSGMVADRPGTAAHCHTPGYAWLRSASVSLIITSLQTRLIGAVGANTVTIPNLSNIAV